MEMTRKQAEFWTVLLFLCVIAATAILMLDFGIKAAILEESTRLRLLIEAHSGKVAGPANANRVANDAPDNTPVPGDVLVVNPGTVETGNVHNGSKDTLSTTTSGRNKPSRPNRNRAVPGGNDAVGT